METIARPDADPFVPRPLRPPARRRRALAAAVAVAAGATVVATVGVVANPGRPSAAATVDAALATTSRALDVSGRAEITWSDSVVHEDGDPAVGSDSGVFVWAFSGDDRSTTIVQWAGSGAEPSDELHEENRWVDGRVYSFMEWDGRWGWFRSSDGDDPAAPAPDATALLDQLQDVDDFEDLGTEVIDGVATQRLRATNPEETPALPALGAFGNEFAGHSLGDVTHLEVWVDEDRVVRRIDLGVFAEYEPSSEVEDAGPVSIERSASIRFTDIGAPIAIEAPPDAENLPVAP